LVAGVKDSSPLYLKYLSLRLIYYICGIIKNTITMTREEILPYQKRVSKGNELIRITLKDGSIIFGYFEAKLGLKPNYWNFVKTPIENTENRITELNGDDFKTIDVIES
jgi:hypothetical protein